MMKWRPYIWSERRFMENGTTPFSLNLLPLLVSLFRRSP